MMTEVRDGERKEDSGISAKEIVNDKKLAASPVGIPGFRLESMDKMKNMQESLTNTGLKMFAMESLDKLIKDSAGDHGNKEKSAKKSSWSHRLTAKISDLGNESKKAAEVKGKEAKQETSALPPEVDARKQVTKGWSHRLAAKRGDDARVESEAKPGEGVESEAKPGEGVESEAKPGEGGENEAKPGEGGREVSGLVGTAAPNSTNVKKPA